MTRAHPLDFPRPRHPARWSAWTELAVIFTIFGLVLGTGVVAGWRLDRWWHRAPVRVVAVWQATCGEVRQEVMPYYGHASREH